MKHPLLWDDRWEPPIQAEHLWALAGGHTIGFRITIRVMCTGPKRRGCPWPRGS